MPRGRSDLTVPAMGGVAACAPMWPNGGRPRNDRGTPAGPNVQIGTIGEGRRQRAGRVDHRAVQDRADQAAGPVAHRRAGRDRHPRVRRLVQPPPATQHLRRHPTRRTRRRPLSSTPAPPGAGALKLVALRTCRGGSDPLARSAGATPKRERHDRPDLTANKGAGVAPSGLSCNLHPHPSRSGPLPSGRSLAVVPGSPPPPGAEPALRHQPGHTFRLRAVASRRTRAEGQSLVTGEPPTVTVGCRTPGGTERGAWGLGCTILAAEGRAGPRCRRRRGDSRSPHLGGRRVGASPGKGEWARGGRERASIAAGGLLATGFFAPPSGPHRGPSDPHQESSGHDHRRPPHCPLHPPQPPRPAPHRPPQRRPALRFSPRHPSAACGEAVVVGRGRTSTARPGAAGPLARLRAPVSSPSAAPWGNGAIALHDRPGGTEPAALREPPTLAVTPGGRPGDGGRSPRGSDGLAPRDRSGHRARRRGRWCRSTKTLSACARVNSGGAAEESRDT